MDIQKILTAVGAAASQLTPIFPPAMLAVIGSGLVGSILTALHSENIQVVDENGNPISMEELAQRANDKFNHAIANAQEGSNIATDEINRTDI